MNIPNETTPIIPTATHQYLSTLLVSLKAFVLYWFSKDLLALRRNEDFVSDARSVGFKAVVGNISGGLYAKYKGCIFSPSNWYICNVHLPW